MDHPHFNLKLILTGLKIAGRLHIRKTIQNLLDSAKEAGTLIGGFDLVGAEDFTIPVIEFVTELQEKRLKDPDNKIPLVMTCGQTHDRWSENVYDAVLLNSTRIAHAFQLALHPHL